MNDFQVDGELATVVVDDEDADAATAGIEGFREAGPKVGLVDDGDGLLDIAGLGHCNDSAILKIKNTVLLEDWAKHGLNDNTWAWVGDERRLFMQLLGEEVNTQVSVLASGR